MSSLIRNEPVTVIFALPPTYVRALMTGMLLADSTVTATDRVAIATAAGTHRLRDGRIKLSPTPIRDYRRLVGRIIFPCPLDPLTRSAVERVAGVRCAARQ